MRPLLLCKLTGQHPAGALLCQPLEHALWRAVPLKLPCSCMSGPASRQQCTLSSWCHIRLLCMLGVTSEQQIFGMFLQKLL